MAAEFLPGNRVTLLNSGSEYFPALLAEIEAAQVEIYLESYIFAGFGFWIFCENFASNPSVGGSDNPLTMFFGNTILFFLPTLAMAPALTMRLFAEERRSGTIEALLTASQAAREQCQPEVTTEEADQP